MTATLDDVVQFCRAASDFTLKSGWMFQASPVLALEFHDIGEFHRARAHMFAIIEEVSVKWEPGNKYESKNSSAFTINGITLVLTCESAAFERAKAQAAMDAQAVRFLKPELYMRKPKRGT